MASWGGGQVSFHTTKAVHHDMHWLCFYTCLCLTHALYGLMYAYGACTAASRVHRHVYEGAHAHLHVRVSTSTCAHQCSTHTHSCAYGHVYTYHPQRYTHRIIYTYTPIHTIVHLTWRYCLPAFQEFSCTKRTVFKVLNYREPRDQCSSWGLELYTRPCSLGESVSGTYTEEAKAEYRG